MTVDAECWLCDDCGEVETFKVDGTSVTVGCPVCVQRDHERLRRRAEAARDDALMQMRQARANELQAMHYLEQIRQLLGHEGDFPSMVDSISRLSNQG